jgi:hypothetical protein
LVWRCWWTIIQGRLVGFCWRSRSPSRLFMTFDFHIGTSKFDVRIYDGTQCQKEYEAEVHCH